MKKALPIYLMLDSAAALFLLLFLYTALTKLRDPAAFVSALAHAPLPHSWITFLAWAVPLAEILAALLLVIPPARFMGLALSTLLMGIFTGYVSWILAFASRLPCACGGVIEKLGWRGHLVLNLGLLSLGILAIILHYRVKSLTRQPGAAENLQKE